MFGGNVNNKRVVIEHSVQALDGKVDLHTTFDFEDVLTERVLLWAAANRLAEWLPAEEIARLKSADVKKRFDNLVINCKDPFCSGHPVEAGEDEIINNLRDLVREGASIERLVQSVIRSTHKLSH